MYMYNYDHHDRVEYYEDPAFLNDHGPDTIVSFYYDVGENRFFEAFTGDIVGNIYRTLTPTQIFLFKEKRETMIFPHVKRWFLVELIYPDDCYLRKCDW